MNAYERALKSIGPLYTEELLLQKYNEELKKEERAQKDALLTTLKRLGIL